MKISITSWCRMQNSTMIVIKYYHADNNINNINNKNNNHNHNHDSVNNINRSNNNNNNNNNLEIMPI